MINKVHLLGRVGKKSSKTTSNGINICNLSLATNKKVKRNNQMEDKTIWHNISLFNKLSEIAEKYVQVGDLVYIEGEIESSSYTDKEGNKKTSVSIIAHELRMMPKSQSKPSYTAPSELDDQLPF